MPWVTDVYKRDIDVTRYNVPFLLYPTFRFTRPAAVRRNALSASGLRH